MNNTVNVLVIGGGGREHALAWKLKQSPQAGTMYVAPGNPGTAMLGCKNIPLDPTHENIPILCDLACHLNIGLAVIGPEAALKEGISSQLSHRGIPTFGPAMPIIESSKNFAKVLMNKVGIPTAPFITFSSAGAAAVYVIEKEGKVVIKADGLAAGKGVRVCENVEQAITTIDDFMVKRILGEAGEKIIIEDKLEGVELSIHALCDGEHVKLFPPVRDHKHLLDDNHGPMTGGMGVYGPIDVEDGLMERIEKEIVLPCVKELASHRIPFVGCLYPGLMLTKDGPKVLEFNARFGDPETQVYMRLLHDSVDLIEILLACVQGKLDQVELRWKKEKCVCVTLATEGYPDKPKIGTSIDLSDSTYKKSSRWSCIVFHGNTTWVDGDLLTNGGRVLSYTKVLPDNVEIPIDWPYDQIERNVYFRGMQYRNDIGQVR